MCNTGVSPGNGRAANGVIGTPGAGDGSDLRVEGARATDMSISTLLSRFPEVNPERGEVAVWRRRTVGLPTCRQTGRPTGRGGWGECQKPLLHPANVGPLAGVLVRAGG